MPTTSHHLDYMVAMKSKVAELQQACGLQASSFDRNGIQRAWLDIPNVFGILRNCSVRGEHSRASSRHDGHFCPGGLIPICLVYLLLQNNSV